MTLIRLVRFQVFFWSWSTLINLVCRFFDVSEGSILVDGNDLRGIDVIDYRRNLGLVLQEPYLFFGTIADNIAYGKPGATRSEIIAAARAARAHEFILKSDLLEAVDVYAGLVTSLLAAE